MYDVTVKGIFKTSLSWQDLWQEGTLNTDDIATKFTDCYRIYHQRKTNLRTELNVSSIVKPRNLETL